MDSIALASIRTNGGNPYPCDVKCFVGIKIRTTELSPMLLKRYITFERASPSVLGLIFCVLSVALRFLVNSVRQRFYIMTSPLQSSSTTFASVCCALTQNDSAGAANSNTSQPAIAIGAGGNFHFHNVKKLWRWNDDVLQWGSFRAQPARMARGVSSKI